MHKFQSAGSDEPTLWALLFFDSGVRIGVLTTVSLSLEKIIQGSLPSLGLQIGRFSHPCPYQGFARLNASSRFSVNPAGLRFLD